MAIRIFKKVLPQIAENAWVDESAIVIGDVTIGADSSIWPTAVIRGDVNSITIGQRTSIQDGTVIHVSHATEGNPGGDAVIVGDDVTVGHRVVLHGCTIEDQCLIGINSVILDKAIVRKHVLIGANSLVPPGKELASGYLYLGSPVKAVRPLTEAEIAFFLLFVRTLCAAKKSLLLLVANGCVGLRGEHPKQH